MVTSQTPLSMPQPQMAQQRPTMTTQVTPGGMMGINRPQGPLMSQANQSNMQNAAAKEAANKILTQVANVRVSRPNMCK